MTTNINLNLNQSPYFEDYDETKDFHQVLYKPAVAVQARELTQEQTILRNQIKRFGNHIFANGSRVQGGELFIDINYEFVKLQTTYNAVAITSSLLSGKTVVGSTSGAKAVVVNTAAVDSVTGDPDTIWVKYISGESITDGVQGIYFSGGNLGGVGYTSTPTVEVALSATSLEADRALATAVLGSSGVLVGINVTFAGRGYTSAPGVTITGGGYSTIATATSVLTTKAVFTAGERITATDYSSSVLAATLSATGTGSAVSNADGYYYFNGNFLRVGAGTLILDKYTNTPTYRMGFQVTASLVSTADDTTLLDNAQGSYNYAAPGADRLKYVLTLTKKTTSSTDDTDFIELMKVNNGVKELDVKYPVYSVLEDTFARRTYDESGSYTVRHFPIQLKDHTSDSSKFIVKVDPGKAYNYGHEYETLLSFDVEVDRARDVATVNGFDRTTQYGNYTIVDTLTGHFDITANAVVDLHNNTSITLTNPTTYATTKIGTAKVRQVNYDSGTATSGVPDYTFKMYLYDVVMTSGDFGDVERVVIPESPLSGTIVLQANAHIANAGKVGGASGGDAKLFETSFNSLVFKLSQNNVKRIRDASGCC